MAYAVFLRYITHLHTMYEPRVISVNPGLKTLGELHNPSAGLRREDAAPVTSCSADARNHLHLFFSRHDLSRPAVVMLVVRVVLGVSLLWGASLLPGDVTAAVMTGVSLLVMAGLAGRIAGVTAVALSFIAVFPLLGSQLVAEAITSAGVTVMCAIPLILSGPGRFSCDRLLWERTHRA